MATVYEIQDLAQNVAENSLLTVYVSGATATLRGLIWFRSNATGGEHYVFTLPHDIKPAGKYRFQCGNGNGAQGDGTGFLDAAGKAYVSFSRAHSYVHFGLTWIVPEKIVTLAMAQNVTSYESGTLAIAGNMCYYHDRVSISTPNGAWYLIAQIPQEYLPMDGVIATARSLTSIANNTYTRDGQDLRNGLWFFCYPGDVIDIDAAWRFRE